MKLSLFNTTLLFKKPFHLSHGTRLGTNALFLSIEHAGKTGYSEATYPPYLTETIESSQKQINDLDLSPLGLPALNLEQELTKIDTTNLSPFTRALLVNCTYDLNAKLKGISLTQELGLKAGGTYKSSITITKSDLESIELKKDLTTEFGLLKLKLDGNNDLDFVTQVLKIIDKPFCVDINQGWENISIENAIEQCIELKQLGCELIEQPFLKTNFAKHHQLKQAKILPVFADESIQNLNDLNEFGANFDGINIKILKCGGIDLALQMAMHAKELNKQIIIGCMSESSCGCSTAFTLSSLAKYLDIDGPWLIKNDPFTGFVIKNGKFNLNTNTGIGVTPSHAIN